ncbi:bifunctional metallophosphatase/5'-nucleotidase [Solibacillus daqui]|uniref:bifunctional metallophosphatase/5'-nucleotidase n=1 Tax=Solibacillus daqui TaxID=2912187 RepID=UPI00236586E4|nr:bifunctional UDP-sugar hydrolase/5'-nucleotidase [Solibacillus daqui]
MKFSIIATSDIHGHTERFSQLASMINSRQPDLLIDNGDFLQGSHLSYFYENIQRCEHPQINMANALQYDVAVFGNHEFNYPLNAIERMRSACNFPWIAANINGFAKDYVIKDIHGIRVAVIGVVTHFTPFWDEGNATKSLHFEQAFNAAQRTVKHVRANEQVDFVILCYHGGFERDLQTGHLIDLLEGENEGYRMLREIDGIDLFITGHQHLEIATKINGISVVQPGANAKCFAQIDVSIEGDNITHEPTLVYVDESLPSFTDATFDRWKNEMIGESACDLQYSDFFTPRTMQTGYVQLLHDMQMHYTMAQLSVIELPYHQNGGFQKQITRKDVLHNLPRQNRLVKIEMTGAEIREALELSASVFAINTQDKIDFSMNVHYPQPQPFVYDLWGGLDYEICLSHPVGQRVVSCEYNGHEMQDNEIFSVVINSYRATGAHDYAMFHKNPIYETSEFVPKLMMAYIQKNSPIQTQVKNHFLIRK